MANSSRWSRDQLNRLHRPDGMPHMPVLFASPRNGEALRKCSLTGFASGIIWFEITLESKTRSGSRAVGDWLAAACLGRKLIGERRRKLMLFRFQTVEAVQGRIRGFPMQSTLMKRSSERSRHQRNTNEPEYCDVHLKPFPLS